VRDDWPRQDIGPAAKLVPFASGFENDRIDKI
jgi:hypothetical protein